MSSCTACDLHTSRTNVVFGEGSNNPRILIIGEAPGEEEDLSGKPFVGPAGQKLNRILDYVGVTRDEIYITNSVLCRPPNNRNPLQNELQACKSRLNEQIQTLKPELIIALGKIAVQQLLGKPFKGPLSQFFPKDPDKIGGDWLTYIVKDLNIKTMITYHPSYILRSPQKGYQQVLPHWNMVKKWVEQEKKTK